MNVVFKIIRNWNPALLTVVFRYFSLGAAFTTSILAARALPPDIFGQYLFVQAVAAVGSVLLGAGILDAGVRLIPAQDTPEQSQGLARSIANFGTLWIASVSFALAFPIALISEHVIQPAQTGQPMSVLYAWSLLWGAAWAYNELASQMALALGREFLAGFCYYAANKLLTLVCVVILYSREQLDFLALMWVSVATTLASAILAMLAAQRIWRRSYPLIPSPDKQSVMRLAFPLMIPRLVAMLMGWGGTWMLGISNSASNVAQFGAAQRIAAVVGSLLNALNFSMRPRMSKLAAKGQYAEMGNIGNRISSLLTTITGLLLAMSVFEGDAVMALLFGDAYATAGIFLTLLLGSIFFQVMRGPVEEFLKMSGHHDFVLKIYILVTPVALASMYLASIFYGGVGVAIVTAIFMGSVTTIFALAVRSKLGFWVSPYRLGI